MDWTEEEVKLIVNDYFTMLQDELSGRPYNKTFHRSNLLPLLKNRSKGAVEFKHQNISAALIKMGLPYIDGYKPRFNYQTELLESQISRYIASNRLRLENQFETFSQRTIERVVATPISYEDVLDQAPENTFTEDREPLYKPTKKNYLEIEQNNSLLGEAGELFVINFEKWRLLNLGKGNLVGRIEWHAKDLGDGLGYDILSKNIDGTDRFIEVKTTKLAKETPIYLTKTELSFASKRPQEFYLYRVFQFARKPQLFIKNGAYDQFCKLVPESYKGYF